MHLADRNTGPSRHSARFSPLKMVAQALGVWQARDAADAASAALPPREASPFRPAAAADAVAPAPGDGFLAIVNAMLEMEDRGDDGLEAGAFDLTAALEESHDVFAAAAEAQGSSLSFVLALDAGGYYRGDAARIRQALLNLTSAALKVGKDAPVAVVVDWSGGELTLSVAGPRIAKLAQDVLATGSLPSSRRSAARQVALAMRAAQAAGGELRVIGGHRVEIAAPAVRIAGAAPASAPAAPEAARPQLAPFAPGLRILVAEESPAHRQVIRTLLAEMGVEAETVADGQALVAAWREQGWDAMLVDIQGPSVCGRSLIREIRVAEAKARWPRTPMIVLSTAPSPDRDDEFAQMIDCALAKPIDATALHAAISLALGSRAFAPSETAAA